MLILHRFPFRHFEVLLFSLQYKYNLHTEQGKISNIYQLQLIDESDLIISVALL